MNLNKDQFELWMQEGKTFLVDFWAPWCGYCRRIAPAYEQIAETYGDRLPITKVNTDQEQALAASQNIEVLPTLILYSQGQKVATLIAPKSVDDIESFLQQHLEQ